MTLFWLLAAGMVAVALLFVLPPLLAPEAAGRRGGSPQAQASLAVLREQLAQLQADHASGRIAPDHYAQARAEIERRALREGCAAPDRLDTRPAPRWALAVALGLGAISVGLYAALGNPAALTPADADAHASPSASAGHDPGDPMVERLAGLIQHLQAHPDDAEGWTTLAHTYATLGDFAGGAATWARMGARAPQDPGVLADWADLLATAADGDFSGEPDRLIGRLLALAPDDVKGLALAGTSAFFRGDFHGAIDAWERLLPLVDPDGPVHEQVQASLAQARRAAEGAAADGRAAEGAATDGGAADRTAADRTAADRAAADRAAAGAEGPAFPPGARASGGRGRQD